MDIPVCRSQERWKFNEELARQSISANLNPVEVVAGSTTELWKGTGGKIMVM